MTKAKDAPGFESSWMELYEYAVNAFIEHDKSGYYSKIGKHNRKRLKKLFKLLQKGY